MEEEKTFSIMGKWGPILLGKMIPENAEKFTRQELKRDPGAKLYDDRGEVKIDLKE